MPHPVLFDEITTLSGQRIGMATLHAEKSLNALTLDMIRRLQTQLSTWEQDAGIVAVLLRGAGERAFCAGGDVRSLRSALLEDDSYPHLGAVDFFSEEYQLDYHIHRPSQYHYPK